MIMSIRDAVEILVGLGLIFLCLKFYEDKRRNTENGKIEIKFTETAEGEEANTTKHTDLILEIRYRLISRSRHNKEEAAVLINELVQRKCKLRGFRIRNNTKKTLKEIKDIMERIKPLLPSETNSEMTSVNYRISEKTITNWPKDIFCSNLEIK